MLLVLYFAFASPHFAYAADVDSIRPEDHNHERLLSRPFFDVDVHYEELELRGISYEAEFLGVDRGIIGRAPTGNEPKGMVNNRVEQADIKLGETVQYVFSNSSVYGEKSTTQAFLSPLRLQGRDFDIEDDEEDGIGENGELKLKRRQSSSSSFRTVYITVNACAQPKALDTTTTVPAPQLQLFISTSQNNTTPGPGQAPQDMVELDGGFGMYAINATGDVYIGVFGNNNTKTAYADTPPWSIELAASIDAPYHYYYNSSDNLSLMDSDSGAALFVAGNPMKLDGDGKNYDKWKDVTTPFKLFMSDVNDQSIMGLQNSYCAWKMKDPGQINVKSSVAKRQLGQLPQEQFYVEGLKKGSKYSVTLAMDGNSTNAGLGVVGGGGIVFRQTNASTQSGKCFTYHSKGCK
jgi:calcium channel MID1